MRLDHIAYRVKDRVKTSKYFCDAFGYKVADEFAIEFDDGSTAACQTLLPPEIRHPDVTLWEFKTLLTAPYGPIKCEYYAAPEIFVSDGPPGSIVGNWVAERGGVGGIHHIAYQVDNVESKMKEWKEKGYVEFLSNDPLTCPGLVQVFTKPSELTGVIYELIARTGKGFCKDNVKNLMESTKKL